jgi:hypothetical protein
MIEFFKWINRLDSLQAWGFFVLVAMVLAIIPFMGYIISYLRIKFSNQKLEIVDFSWRLIPDQLFEKSDERSLYFSSVGAPVLYEGMVILLTWKVIGAHRIDVHPLGSKLKGNSARVVIKKGDNLFTLFAYAPSGKISHDVIIKANEVRTLKTFNISNEKHFGQDENELLVSKIASLKYNGLRYSLLRQNNLRKYFFSSIIYKFKKNEPSNRSILFQTTLKNEKKATQIFIESQKLLKTYIFKPSAYNQAISENQINHNS